MWTSEIDGKWWGNVLRRSSHFHRSIARLLQINEVVPDANWAKNLVACLVNIYNPDYASNYKNDFKVRRKK